MAEQLIKKTEEGYSNVMPKSWIEAITDKSTGESLTHILQGFNMYFLSYTGNTEQTRCQVSKILRRKGLWITYVKYDGNVYTEWYNSNDIDDKSWGNSSNWRVGNNELVGDLTISANGNWVINGNETEFRAIGEKGNTPLIRIANNKLQVSYDTGNTYHNVDDNPVYTQIRTYNNKLQISTDLGANWVDASDEIAAYFRFNSGQGNNVGNIQISRNNKDWNDLSGNFVNNLHISKYIGANETLPTSGVAEGTIYAKGPTYADNDTSHSNPIYRLWVYAYKGNTLAWQDNGEFTSINAGITQELGNSENLVVSQKRISQEIIQGGVYDVSAHNNNAVFESLQALLSSSNLSTLIPPLVRHGGMSIKFIQGSEQSSDNKYVQYRLMANTFSTTVTDWQGVDDEIADNNNLISNAGVYGLKDKLLIGTQFETITDEAFVNNGSMYGKGSINSSNTNYKNTDLIPVKTGDVVTIDYTLYTEYEAICLYGLDVVGYLAKTYNTGQAIPKITVTQDGYVRFCKKATDTDGSAIHIYHNGGELNEINEKLDELIYTGDANIQLKEDDFKYVGSLTSSGVIYTSNTNCICTDLIEVGQNKNIVTNLYISYGIMTWVQYAEDRVTAVAYSGSVISASLRTFTMNSAAKYIRFCWEYKGNNKKPFPVVKYECSVVSEINNIKNRIATLETKHNIEYYSKNFELENRGGGYINSNTGAAVFEKTGYASPWIPLRKGIYKIKTEINCEVNVFKHVLYNNDYATNERINTVKTKANVESILVLSEAGFMRVTPFGNVTTGAEGIHIEQFGELEGDMPVLPKWDKLHISGFDNRNIWLYIPMGSGVFEIVNLRHYTSSYVEYMMDHWGIDTCYLSTNANEKTIVSDYPITRSSEYEQAIDIVSDTHNGYIGGHMHGYEQMDSIQIKVDGVTKNDYHFCDDCEQVEIIQYSTLYETDKSTEIAKVTKRWVFDNKKFDTFINTIFSKGVTINRCMTAMFGILRRLEPKTGGDERGAYLTNKGMKDTSWQIVSTTDGWDNPSTYTDGAQMLMAGNNEATHLEQWGDLGYKTVLEVPKASRLTGAGMFIDTNGSTYNKMYYNCGSGQMNIGDYIFSHAIFKFSRFLI